MRYFFKFIFLLPLMLLLSCKGHRIDEPAITANELEEHINYLASEKLKGRLPGTEGDFKSASYIRDLMKSWELVPAVENGLQGFEIVVSLEAGNNNFLSIDNHSISNDQFLPYAFSENTSHSGPAVFAGYGFSIESDTLNWNDYKNIDVQGRWVMILRGDPEIDNSSSNFVKHSADRDKVMLAKDKGAGGVLMVSGEKYDPKDEFEALSEGEFSTGIPVFRIKRETANRILKAYDVTISELEEKLNSTYAPASFETDCAVEGTSALVEQRVTTHNVLMILPGNDSILRDEYIIIGGHYDHLGMGGPGSSSRTPDTSAVHYGADDNASGIASLLEIAERFAAEKNNARSILFAGFAAEEMGLLGSKYLVDHLPVEAEKVNAMINLDMIGRLKETRQLQVGGVGTASEFRKIILRNIDTLLLTPSLSEEGYGPSDHSSFYGKAIPVLFFSTGAHLDYHTPYDTPDKINYPGLVTVSELVYNISLELAGKGQKLTFREAGPKTQNRRRMRHGGGVTLGIMPDFAGNIKNGLRADFVIPGRPAALGGMKKDDIITAINGKAVNNIEDYMYRLSKLKAGENIQVEIIRDNKKELLLIAL
ncbi:MAG: M20/M25/M40 family metallo-hydrolase [Bacteroidota bacterium]